MAEQNLFQELKDILQDFKDFLDENVPVIKPAIQALASLIPQVTELIDKLIELMNKLKAEVEKLDVAGIPGLSEASEFTDKVKSFLTAAKNLLPDESDTIDEVLGVADVVTGLPSLDEVKAEITTLIDAIVAHLNSLKAA
jgi:ABC-type transporter Mla subunit MlaD